jgi:hypothetical protein
MCVVVLWGGLPLATARRGRNNLTAAGDWQPQQPLVRVEGWYMHSLQPMGVC